MTDKAKVHEPLFRIKKNIDIPVWKTWVIRLGSVAASLVVLNSGEILQFTT